MQDREDLRPKSNLVAVKQEIAATQIQGIAIETQSLCLRLRASVSISSLVIAQPSTVGQRRFSISELLDACHGSDPNDGG